ncbi:unnamed protein product [Prorocentrum cordatum]|uniref:Uncharacterized protein n=1 Tax=Prorocentrum cordatum TaxID=2364126 RepID=A0ABN9UDL4_9DINO|nr:unnamed protein product [Polarella glacialis]
MCLLRWVQELTANEFADELVVLCALKLAVRIAIIPFAPPRARGEWAVVEHGPEGADGATHSGSNGVHSVHLSRSVRGPCQDLPGVGEGPRVQCRAALAGRARKGERGSSEQTRREVAVTHAWGPLWS